MEITLTQSEFISVDYLLQDLKIKKLNHANINKIQPIHLQQQEIVLIHVASEHEPNCYTLKHIHIYYY